MEFNSELTRWGKLLLGVLVVTILSVVGTGAYADGTQGASYYVPSQPVPNIGFVRGTGYFELPAGDRIEGVYQKEATLAFLVHGRGETSRYPYAAYIVTFDGKVLWFYDVMKGETFKGKIDSETAMLAAYSYILHHGWNKASYDDNDPDNDEGSVVIGSTGCDDLFFVPVRGNVSNSGSFIRFLPKYETITAFPDCRYESEDKRGNFVNVISRAVFFQVGLYSTFEWNSRHFLVEGGGGCRD